MATFKRNFYGITKDPTCCLSDLGLDRELIHTNLRYSYDHILCTDKQIKTRTLNTFDFGPDSNFTYPTYTSDHLPVYGEIPLPFNKQGGGGSNYYYKYLKYKNKYLNEKITKKY
jgi:hypothetical protein